MQFYDNQIMQPAEDYVISCQEMSPLISHPRDIVKHAAIVHPSVTYLDLGICDYKRLRTTPAGSVAQRRAVIMQGARPPYAMVRVGTHDLGSPLHFNLKLLFLDGVEALECNYGVVDNNPVVDPGSYTVLFDLDIVDCVEKSQNKTRDLRKGLQAMKTMKSDWSSELFKCFLDVLMEEQCEDSGLLMEFVEFFGHNLIAWLVGVRNERYLDYVLHHTQRLGFDIFREEYMAYSPLSISMLSGFT